MRDRSAFLGECELAAIGLGEARFFALGLQLTEYRRVKRGCGGIATGDGPVTFGSHRFDHFAAGHGLTALFENADRSVQGAELPGNLRLRRSPFGSLGPWAGRARLFGLAVGCGGCSFGLWT